jgi:hypothetical protein
MMPKNVTAVDISTALVNKIRARVVESKGEFLSVEDYIEFVLGELFKDEGENESEREGFSKEESSSLEQRFKALGYL